MSDFNKELISKVKVFHAGQLDEGDITEEKYSFLKYIFTKLESTEGDFLDICEEEFADLDCNIDGYYYDEDSNVYNLYLTIYDDHLDDHSTLTEDAANSEYRKIINFVKMVCLGKYIDFGENGFTYEIADSIYKSLTNGAEIIINVVTNYLVPSEYKKDSVEEIEKQTVSFRTYDLEDLQNKLDQVEKTIDELDLEEKFGAPISALRVASNQDFDVYCFTMKGSWLATLYKEDSIRLLEPNVRSYLKRTSKVNAGILETVKTAPEEFISFNNGIAAVATGLVIDRANSILSLTKITKILNFQIVNGGQTTATLFECFKDKLFDNLDKVNAIVKLTVVKNISNSESLIRSISTYSNTQTAIKKSDPPSNLPYYIAIKQLSQKCLSEENGISYMCYFERTNGEYETDFMRNKGAKRFTNANPKDKKFTKIQLATAIDCWEQLPYIACKGSEGNFAFFNDVVKNQLFDPDENYFKNAYATIIIFRKLDKIAKKLKLSVKSNVVSYTLSLISLLYNKQIVLEQIWDKKDLTPELVQVAYDLLPKVHAVIINTPPECPEPRMWARKEKCWSLVQAITTNCYITKSDKKVEFFQKNDALMYIGNDTNFYDASLWLKLLFWDNKNKALNKKQVSMVKNVKTKCDFPGKGLTKKQIEYAKDIFLYAVKCGFKYI